ncbi:chemotaxis protein CheW [Legionella sp. 27cVA30]|uniref:chemotaxis protein CheW n=1 Tax=Legionella sp. 27cVA30 TaxID=2905657 RepID=UPI0020A15EE9|nr:chemotaxis protein CheW [Legionella sp. 27cVA30]MCP0914151.1 chemotaxis protein CheW [Legionella sp. 27cVA30]
MTEPSKLKILLCRLSHIDVCIELQYVIKAFLIPLFKIIPNSPPYLAGLINWGGHSIPLVDWAFCMGSTREEPYSPDTPVLLCTDGKQFAGVIVDKILGLIEVEKTQLQLNDAFREEKAPFAAAVTIDANISLLIDIHQLLKIQLTESKIPALNNR